MILTTDEVITTILKFISATTKVIFATEEVITTILKLISATAKVILASEEVITATFQNMSHYKSDLCFCSIFLARDRHSQFHISDMHVENKKYGNFVSISRLTGKCAAKKNKKTFHF